MVSKLSPYKRFTSYKRKNSHLTVQKPGIQHHNQAIKVNITSNKTGRHHVPPTGCTEGHNITSLVFLSKNASCHIRNYQTNPNWGIFYNITDQYSPKVSRSWKTQNIGEITGIRQLNATHDGGLDPGPEGFLQH